MNACEPLIRPTGEVARFIEEERVASSQRIRDSEIAAIRRRVAEMPVFDPYRDIETPPPLTPEGQAVLAEVLRRDSSSIATYRETVASAHGGRRAGKRKWCERAQPVAVVRETTTRIVFPECKSRTCSTCKEGIDDRDVGRVLASLGDSSWFDEIPRAEWNRVRQRAWRRGAVAVKMQSPHSHDRVVILSSEPMTDSSTPVEADMVEDFVRNRRTGGTGRANLTGPGLISVADWEARDVTRHEEQSRVVLDPTVTPESIVEAAREIGLPIEEAHRTVTLDGGWDDPRIRMLLDWARNPLQYYRRSMRLRPTESVAGHDPPGAGTSGQIESR